MSDNNIVRFNGITTLDMEADKILNGALDANLEAAVVVGYGKDGGLYFATSFGDEAHVLLLLEKAKRELLDMLEDE